MPLSFSCCKRIISFHVSCSLTILNYFGTKRVNDVNQMKHQLIMTMTSLDIDMVNSVVNITNKLRIEWMDMYLAMITMETRQDNV